MTRRVYVILAGLLTLGVMLMLLMNSAENVDRDQDARDMPTDLAGPSRLRAGDDGRGPLRRKVSTQSEVSDLRGELEKTKGELELLSRPLNENDVLSAAVNAVVAKGESLVTGGYKLADGRYELTFITPKGVDMTGQSPGSDMIVFEARSILADDAFVKLGALETLATNARNTLQHAEAWSGDDVFNTFKSASEAEGVDMDSLPNVTARPNEPCRVEMMDAEGRGYLLNLEADFLPDGSFAVKARAERRE